jgi:DNA polymerase III epsilon subunit-like protein
MRICFVDVESTGTDVDRDELIEVCAVVWNDGKTAPSYSKRFFPTGPLEQEAQIVNGYDRAVWERDGAEYFTAAHAEKIGEVLAYAGILGGAAVAFDRDMLKRAFERVRVPFPKLSHRLVDVQSMGAPLVFAELIKTCKEGENPDLASPVPSLAQLQEYFGLGPVKHNAVEDVFNTIKVFEKLLQTVCPYFYAAAQKGSQA